MGSHPGHSTSEPRGCVVRSVEDVWCGVSRSPPAVERHWSLGPVVERSVVMVMDLFVFGDRLVACDLRVRASGGFEVRLPCALGAHAEERQESLEVGSLTPWTDGERRIAYERLELLAAVQAFEFIERH